MTQAPAGADSGDAAHPARARPAGRGARPRGAQGRDRVAARRRGRRRSRSRRRDRAGASSQLPSARVPDFSRPRRPADHDAGATPSRRRPRAPTRARSRRRSTVRLPLRRRRAGRAAARAADPAPHRRTAGASPPSRPTAPRAQPWDLGTVRVARGARSLVIGIDVAPPTIERLRRARRRGRCRRHRRVGAGLDPHARSSWCRAPPRMLGRGAGPRRRRRSSRSPPSRRPRTASAIAAAPRRRPGLDQHPGHGVAVRARPRDRRCATRCCTWRPARPATGATPLWLEEGFAEYVGYRGSGVPLRTSRPATCCARCASGRASRLAPDRARLLGRRLDAGVRVRARRLRRSSSTRHGARRAGRALPAYRARHRAARRPTSTRRYEAVTRLRHRRASSRAGGPAARARGVTAAWPSRPGSRCSSAALAPGRR